MSVAILRAVALWHPFAWVSASALAMAPDSLETVQRIAADWARIRAETVRLESEWEWQRELLTSTVTALQERARGLEERRDLLQAQTAQTQRELAALSAQTQASAEAMQRVEERLVAMTRRLLGLRPVLPPRLSEALELPYRSLGDTMLPASERIQAVATMLARCAQFNRSITYSEEPLALEAAHEPRLLEVVYWGLSHAYALDRVSRRAYLGAPANGAWAWQARPDITERVEQLIAIYKDDAEPRFVEVPVTLGAADRGGGVQ
jgi:hypothetical protein